MDFILQTQPALEAALTVAVANSDHETPFYDSQQ